MAADICVVQVQPGSATVRGMAMVPEPIRDGANRRPAVGELVKNSHAHDVTRKRDDEFAQREPNDTALILKSSSCKSNTVEKPRSRAIK